jgi:hypothetical protein
MSTTSLVDGLRFFHLPRECRLSPSRIANARRLSPLASHDSSRPRHSVSASPAGRRPIAPPRTPCLHHPALARVGSAGRLPSSFSRLSWRTVSGRAAQVFRHDNGNPAPPSELLSIVQGVLAQRTPLPALRSAAGEPPVRDGGTIRSAPSRKSPPRSAWPSAAVVR